MEQPDIENLETGNEPNFFEQAINSQEEIKIDLNPNLFLDEENLNEQFNWPSNLNITPAKKTWKRKSLNGLKLKDRQIGHSKTRRWRCTSCGNGFKSRTCLKLHKVNHEVKEFKCGNRFANKQCLENAMIGHSEERRWACKFCGERYKNKPVWKRHLKEKHGQGYDDQV